MWGVDKRLVWYYGVPEWLRASLEESKENEGVSEESGIVYQKPPEHST